MEDIKVIKFITFEEALKYEENGLGGFGGIFARGMRWKDYKEIFNEQGRVDVETLRKAIIENDIKCTGEQHQRSDYKSVPLWSNGKVDTYTYRAWGDLMAAVWSEEEDKDYSYFDFYM